MAHEDTTDLTVEFLRDKLKAQADTPFPSQLAEGVRSLREWLLFAAHRLLISIFQLTFLAFRKTLTNLVCRLN